MRYENEKKEINKLFAPKSKQISTWDLLHEVDKLMEHVPTWEPFDGDPLKRRKYLPQYYNLVSSTQRKKRPWSI